MMKPCSIILALFFVLGATDQALAWGPAVHVGLAGSILEQLFLLPAAVGAVLTRYSCAYLYGNIAPDFVFAKRLSRIRQSCHHWSTGFGLLESATDDRGKAFAYGYLSHLAADTVAHGKYVPHQIGLHDCSVNFGHFYWELRADATERSASRRLLERIIALDHSDHEETLESHVTDTFLPHDLNRLVFDRVNSVAAHRRFHMTMRMWNRCSRWLLSTELLAGYQAESLDRIRSVLTDGSRSPVLREDPNGTSALMQLSVRKREMRRLKRQGLPIAHRLLETSRSLAPRAGDRWFRDLPTVIPVPLNGPIGLEIALQP